MVRQADTPVMLLASVSTRATVTSKECNRSTNKSGTTINKVSNTGKRGYI